MLREVMTAGQLGERMGAGKGTVYTWISRGQGFPQPVGYLAGGDVYWWPEVREWLIKTGRTQYT